MDNVIKIRDIELKDLDSYYRWMSPEMEHHKFNGPYFKHHSESELKDRIENIRALLKKRENPLPGKKLLVDSVNDALIGQVNWYWKSEETLWMEIGIVIFNSDYWVKGIGYTGLKMWTDHIFESNPKLVRLGLTTWSGNRRMIKLAEKLGFAQEARYRKARFINNVYYDSLSYGILREEWESYQSRD